MLIDALRRRAIVFTCGAMALATAVVVVVLVLRPEGWSPTALPRVGANTKLAAKALQVDPGFRTVIGPYDGQFYWAIALDPVAVGDVHQRVDDPPYRYGHPLYGWLGWLASVGQARAAPTALLVVGLLAMAAAGGLAAELARELGRSGWEGLAVAFNPGLLYSAAHDLTEPLSVALLLGALLAYVRGRRPAATALFALLVLSKEAFLLVPITVVAWELLRGRRQVARLLPLAALLPAAGWWVYLRLHLGAWFFHASNALALPFTGWRRTLVDAGVQSYVRNPRPGSFRGDYYQFLGAEARLVVLVPVLALLAFTALRALRLRSPVDAAYLALAVVAACLSMETSYLLRDALRSLGVVLALVPFAIASPRTAPVPDRL